MSINEDLMKHADFGETQSGKDILGRIKFYEDEPSVLADCVRNASWPKGKDTIEVRTIIHDKINEADITSGKYDLAEAKAPKALHLKYGLARYGIRNYGTKIKYSAHAVYYNIDNIIADAGNEIGAWQVELKNRTRVMAMLKSNSVLTSTAGTSVKAILDDAEAVFRKLHTRPWSGRYWRVITTTEVIKKLKEELQETSELLSDRIKDKLLDDYAGTYGRFDLYTPAVEELLSVPKSGTEATDTQYLIFLGKTFTGESPIVEYKMAEGSEVINNPLGTGLVEANNDGAATDEVDSDDNHQIGSIACNLRGFGDYLTDQRCVLIAKAAINNIDTTRVKTKFEDQTAKDIRGNSLDPTNGQYGFVAGSVKGK